MSHATCCCHPSQHRRRSDGLFATVFKLLVGYVLVVWIGGALMHVGHPVASEVGQLIHVMTLVEPAIRWTDALGWDAVAHGLRALADGAPLSLLV